MRRRVVITGLGVITPLGDTPAELFRTQLAGQSGVGPDHPLRRQHLSDAVRRRGQKFRPRPLCPSHRSLAHAGAASRFAAAAAKLALDDAGLLDIGTSTARASASTSASARGRRTFTSSPVVARSYRPDSDCDTVTLLPRGARALSRGPGIGAGAAHASAHVADYFDLKARISAASRPAPPAARPSARRSS